MPDCSVYIGPSVISLSLFFEDPTQKPVLLLEDLIKTFSNENDLVVDLTMGSGSTGVACRNTNRNFIGIEKDENYYNVAVRRCS
jgi:site-specific DNA-methyltransferase (adenine-specific)